MRRFQDDPQFTPPNQAEDICGPGNTIRHVVTVLMTETTLFNTLERRGSDPGSNPGRTPPPVPGVHPIVLSCARKRQKSGGYRQWTEKTGYGQRWKAENAYSAVTRIFGESVRTSSREGMMREAMMKFRC
jgi:hypothetical protein